MGRVSFTMRKFAQVAGLCDTFLCIFLAGSLEIANFARKVENWRVARAHAEAQYVREA